MQDRFFRWLSGEGSAPRVMLVVAHPDDETIGASSILVRAPVVRVLCVTDGAPRDPRWWGDRSMDAREGYAALRRREMEDALRVAGVSFDALVQLPIADQEASLDLAGLARRVRDEIASAAPDVVLAHPYEGGHPDHDAAAFAVHAACALLAREGRPSPAIVEFASYHASGDGIAAGTFLPRGSVAEMRIALPADDLERKRRMLACHASQAAVLGMFVVDAEPFRAAPAYDFTAPPHAGTLNYERYDWGCTGAEWRARAAAAMRALGIDSSAGNSGAGNVPSAAASGMVSAAVAEPGD